MMRCFQVIVLIYSSIYIQNRMAHWHSKNNISFIRRCCDLLFGRFLMEHLLYYMLSTMCCIYWSRRYISGLMMNILIMQTIRPIIAFYFIFLFMLIRHSSNETEMYNWKPSSKEKKINICFILFYSPIKRKTR